MAQRLANEFDIHVPASLVYTATLATIDYMKETNRGKKVFVIGEAGLIDLILEAGFEWDETNPDYVVVGLDTELSYEKVVLATLAIQKGRCLLGPIQIRTFRQKEAYYLVQVQLLRLWRQLLKQNQFILANQKRLSWNERLRI